MLDDYMDVDVAYLTGLIVARGMIDEDRRQLVLRFPLSNLAAEGLTLSLNQKEQLLVSIHGIRDRLIELMNTDVVVTERDNSVDLVASFGRNCMVWRNILLILGHKTSFPHFTIPEIFFDVDIPSDWRQQFVRGYGDVAGNVRRANRYADGRFRVRLDVLNYRTNWQLPVQLCMLLQDHLGVPVQLVNWGHPNMNRAFREHQINIFAESYLCVGFTVAHKQAILQELADDNLSREPYHAPRGCPGRRRLRKQKLTHAEERNQDHLDPRLVGEHFDSYWQICKQLGCGREPIEGVQEELEFDDETEVVEE